MRSSRRPQARRRLAFNFCIPRRGRGGAGGGRGERGSLLETETPRPLVFQVFRSPAPGPLRCVGRALCPITRVSTGAQLPPPVASPSPPDACGNAALAAALDSPGSVFCTGGHAPWRASGTWAVAGTIGNGQSSSLSLKVTGPATILFYWRASTQAEGDVLRFAVDGAAHRLALSGGVRACLGIGVQRWGRCVWAAGPSARVQGVCFPLGTGTMDGAPWGGNRRRLAGNRLQSILSVCPREFLSSFQTARLRSGVMSERPSWVYTSTTYSGHRLYVSE